MTNTICLDKNYSTTRVVTQEKPEIINNPEDKFETVLFLPQGENRKGEGGLRTKGYFKKSFENKPLISVITVVYNGEKYLEETIQSVINQTYDNVEYIIIDGGSTDGTLDIIKKYEDKIDYWVSERDKGIYDAMNKGIKLFIGDFIVFLNAGDSIYEYNIFNLIFKNKINFINDIIYGHAQLINSDNSKGKIVKAPSSISYKDFAKGMIVCHQSLIISRRKILLYNLEYKLVSDHDWIIKILKETSKITFLDLPLCNYLLEGISDNNFYLCWKERLIIIKKNFSFFYYLKNYITFLIRILKKIIKRFFL